MLVDFYQLSRAPLERVLPSVAERILSNGERLLVVAEPDLIERLDAQLWGYAPDSFLPHGRSSAERQPVLLASEPKPTNGATNVALADGRWRDEALRFARVFYFFDSGHLDEARQTWRALKDRGDVERRYWKQDERGKWLQGP